MIISRDTSKYKPPYDCIQVSLGDKTWLVMVMAPSLTDLPYHLAERFVLILRAFGALEEPVCSSQWSPTFSAMSPSLELRETRSVATYDGFLRPNPPSTKNAAEIS